MKYDMFHSHPAAQLKSHPNDKDETEAQSQLKKSDEIQRIVIQARAHFDRKEYSSAVVHLDVVIEVSKQPYYACHYIIGVVIGAPRHCLCFDTWGGVQLMTFYSINYFRVT